MNKAPNETTLTLWMDGELHGDELQQMEAYAKEHPELLAERDAVQAMSRSIQDNLPASIEPPYPDFFNQRVLHAIEAERPVETVQASSSSVGFWKWLIAPAAAGAMAVCFYLGTQVNPTGAASGVAAVNASPNVTASTVYTPDSSVESNIFVAGDQQTTVILLEGLEDIPDDMDMAGGPIQDPNKVMVNTENYY